MTGCARSWRWKSATGCARRWRRRKPPSKRPGANVGWVAPENIHLTLVFLGVVGAERIQSIADEMDRIGAGTPAFSFEVNGIGSFGGKRPKIVWAGVGEGESPIASLQKQVDAALRAMGFTLEERLFHSHLTLGRVRSPKGSEALMKGLAELEDSRFGRVEAKSVLLMRSCLQPQGPVYSVLHESPLRGV